MPTLLPTLLTWPYVPERVTLKRLEDFKFVATAAKRLDAAAKVNGTAVYGIDVRPPAHQAACDAPTIFRFSLVCGDGVRCCCCTGQGRLGRICLSVCRRRLR